MAEQQQEMTLKYLDTLVGKERRALRWYASWASIIAVAGFIIMGASLLWGGMLGGEYLKVILGIGGGFISTGSTLPLKELLNCRDRLDLYKMFRGNLRAAEPGEVEQIRNIVLKAITNIAGS